MGKKLSLFFLLLVLVVFALPPLFTPPYNTGIRKIEFTVFSATSVALSLVLLSISQGKRIASPTPKDRFSSLILSLKAATFCFAALMLIFAFFQLLSVLSPLGLDTIQGDIEPPDGVAGWLSFVLALASAAFFEEALYRQFLPQMLIPLLPQKRAFTVIGELLCVALFAFAHKGGTLSVLNAAFCAVALRFFRIRSPSLFPVFAAHFAYNLTLCAFSLLS